MSEQVREVGPEADAAADQPASEAAGRAAHLAPATGGVVIGLLMGFDGAGAPLVVYPGNLKEEVLPARTTAGFAPADVGCAVALLFEDGELTRLLVIGRILHPSAGSGLGTAPRADPCADRRRTHRAHRRARDRAALRQGEHHADQRRQDPAARRLHLQPLDRRQQDQGRLGAAELEAARAPTVPPIIH